MHPARRAFAPGFFSEPLRPLRLSTQRPTQLPTSAAHSTDPFVRSPDSNAPTDCPLYKPPSTAPSTAWPGPCLETLLEVNRWGRGEAHGAECALGIDSQIEPEPPFSHPGGPCWPPWRAKGGERASIGGNGPGAAPGRGPAPAAAPRLRLVDTVARGGDGAGKLQHLHPSWALCGRRLRASVVPRRQSQVPAARWLRPTCSKPSVSNLKAPPQCGDRGLAPQVGLTFLFAPGWHPALVAWLRCGRRLGVGARCSICWVHCQVRLCPEAR